MNTFVISLGGSNIVPDAIDTDFLKSFRKMILARVKQGDRFIIICGGGKTCRTYQNAASEISNAGTTDRDWVGIASTRLNAELVRAIFSEHAYERVYGDPEEWVDTDKQVIIGAGWLPGHSSDMDAVLLAKTFGANTLINMSNIDRAYDSDPKSNPDARPIDSISWDDFQKIVGNEWKPGMNVPFDPNASKKAKEIGLKVIILNGTNLENLTKCLEGKEYTGTTIK